LSVLGSCCINYGSLYVAKYFYMKKKNNNINDNRTRSSVVTNYWNRIQKKK